MAAEAGVLGVPFIRHNGFVGRISYLDELENTYHLGFGVPADEPEAVLATLRLLLDDRDRKSRWQERRTRMLSDKIDVAKYIVEQLCAQGEDGKEPVE